MLADIAADTVYEEVRKLIDSKKIVYVSGSNNVQLVEQEMLSKPFHLNDFLEFISKR
ncbi:MAG: hypothetical protein NE334_06960 [Lentisphaeraceae bacterium]|nr:hypothetical protein [Lentisphaeraceae bacterium]